MCKWVGAILLLCLFVVETFNKAVIILDYYSNTSSFAKNCENRNKPMMHCNGKCQMMKKLKEAEKKEQQKNGRKQIDQDWTCNHSDDEIVQRQLSGKTVQSFYFVSPLTGPSYSIFHPPIGTASV